jgi:hypothetical protein
MPSSILIFKNDVVDDDGSVYTQGSESSSFQVQNTLGSTTTVSIQKLKEHEEESVGTPVDYYTAAPLPREPSPFPKESEQQEQEKEQQPNETKKKTKKEEERKEKPVINIKTIKERVSDDGDVELVYAKPLRRMRTLTRMVTFVKLHIRKNVHE